MATRVSLLLACLLLITGGALGNVITREGGGGDEGGVSVPEDMLVGEEGVVVVRNGTSEAVLDCPYHTDQEHVQGLHVKWYYPDDANLVYQWIPDHEPTSYRILVDRADLAYEFSTEPLHRHRALRILNPTSELAGAYRCLATSFSADTTFTKHLVVFTEPNSLDMWVEEKEEAQVAVTCKVEGVFPQPVLQLYQKSSTGESDITTGATSTTFFTRGAYNMEVAQVVGTDTLGGTTQYECHMTIPRTKIRVVTLTKYQPRVTVTTGAVTGGGNGHQASLVLVGVVFLLVGVLRH